MKTKEYERGYYKAIKVMNSSSETVQELYNQSAHSLTSDEDFDKGWRAACIERGAEEQYHY